MSTFKITMNSISGEYEAADEAAALDLFAKDAGYQSWEDACAQGLASDDEVSVTQERDMIDFISTAAARETSVEIMEAIRAIAGSEAAAARVWEAPSYEETLAVWERVTNNGLRDSADFCWGAAGSKWAKDAGIEG